MIEKILARSLRVMFLGGVGLLAQQALAQEAQDDSKIQRVEITGSSIKRIQAEGSLPVITISRKDIERTGAASVAELIKTMTSMQNGTTTAATAGGGGNGQAAASLHDAGPERTLVLLNGHRVANFGGQTVLGGGVGIDLNTIPLAAIERIEILTDGASALYGSDAIGGVMNFILKSNSTEGDASVSYSRPAGGVGNLRTVSVTKGFGDLEKDKFNVLLSYSNDKQSPLVATSRDISKTSVLNFDFNGKSYRYGNGSGRTNPATLYTDNDIFSPGSPPCPAGHFLSGTNCRYDYAPVIVEIPDSTRDSFMSSLNVKVGGQTVFSELVLSKFKITEQVAAAPVDVTVPANSPLWSTILGFDPLTEHADFALRADDAGPRTSLHETKAVHFTLGIKGNLSGWDYNGSYVHSTNSSAETHIQGWLKNNAGLAAVTGVDPVTGALTGRPVYNPFLGSGKNTAEAIAELKAAEHIGELKRGESTLDTLELRVSHELFKADGGPAMIAAGANLDHEKFKTILSDFALGAQVSGDTIFGDQVGETPLDVSRRTLGFFSEVMVPLTKQLEATGSLRHDRMDDVGNSTTYKLSMKYSPVKEFLVRGSIGTGFRAPTPAQRAASTQLYGVTGGSYVCPANFDPNLCNPISTSGTDGVQWQEIATGNTKLKPEKSNQWTVGFRYEPSSFLSAGLDVWQVKLRDRIDSVSETTIFSDPVAYAKYFANYYDAGLQRDVLGMVVQNDNFDTAVKRGVDFDVAVGYNTGFGKIRHKLQGTVMLKDEYVVPVTKAVESSLGRFGADANVVFRDQFALSNTLTTGNWSHGLTFNYKSGYDDEPISATNLATGHDEDVVRHVSSYLTMDWQTRYQFTKSFALTAGVINFADRAPPMSVQTSSGLHAVGFDGRYADIRQRTLYANLNYSF